MNKTVSILITGIILTVATSVSAQDTTDLSSQLDPALIQQLACMANDANQQSSSSLDNIGSMLNETLALYSENLTEEQLESAYEQSNQAVAQLNLDASIQQLCSGS